MDMTINNLPTTNATPQEHNHQHFHSSSSSAAALATHQYQVQPTKQQLNDIKTTQLIDIITNKYENYTRNNNNTKLVFGIGGKIGGSVIKPTLSVYNNLTLKAQKTDAPMLNYIFDTHLASNKHHHHDQRYGPHFEDIKNIGNITNITIQAGDTAHLNCRISLLQDKTVSVYFKDSKLQSNCFCIY